MAKRPPSNPTAEADLVVGTEPVEAAEPIIVEPVAMEEPAVAESAYIEPKLTVTDEPPQIDPIPDLVPPSARAQDEKPLAKNTSGGGFVGTALGGIVAAAAGYALATFAPFPGMSSPDGPPPATQAEVQALVSRIEALEAAPAPDASLAERIAALEAQPAPSTAAEQDLSPLTDALTALEERMQSIESRAPSTPGETPSADLVALIESLRAQVAEMQTEGADANAEIQALVSETEARLAEAESQAGALRAEAEEVSRKAVAAAAMSRIQAALESGMPFAGALADIPDVEIPPALASLAEAGVPSRAVLEDSFPPAARAALEASLRANQGEGWTDRISSFLQATTGARSLTPREGDDPDAVLSRAEAAVRSGDLELALTELQGLPPAGMTEMSDWIAMAEQRLDAVSAAAALSAAVEG